LGTFWHASGQAAPGPREAWRRGLVLLKQKKFDAACELIASAANAEQTTATIWADLGLCELKRGHADAAVHASLLAARFGDERTRKNAYFNLNLASYEVDIPGEACGPVSVAPEAACTAPLFACTKNWQQYGTAEGDSGTVAVFDTDLEGARTQTEDASFAGEATGNALDLSESHACFFTWCGFHGWECDSSPVVSKRVEACYVKQHGPMPKDLCLRPSALCESFQKCSEGVCAQANAAISGAPGAKHWPAVEREYDRSQAACMADCREGETLSCSVVYVDPCQSRIGYVCSISDLKTGRVATEARELVLATN
jgi:hypothetical protein